ncbi:MAG: uncharacterized protein JWO36_3866 [Myxococcales bacterium]|nr:uncharacterized protein [Myxococcales bacterium]
MPMYIEVTRHFRNLADPADRAPVWMTPRENALTWAGVLWPGTTDDIVLHAPSGTGKTTEVFREAERRRAAGICAVAATATAIVEDGLRAALDHECATAFDAWIDGSGPAIIFVDAVDELALRHRSLLDVLRKVGVGAPLSRRDVQLVIAVRSGTWQGQHTGELEEFLRVGRAVRDSGTELAAQLNQRNFSAQRVRELKFAPLDRDAVRALAVGYGVVEIDSFLDGVRHEELQSLFDLRPRDVKWLVRKWNESRRLGKWSELLDAFCRNALEDEHPDRSHHRQLTVQDAHRGLQRVAAAVEFGKRSLLALPTEDSTDAMLSSRRLFEDWPTVKLQELFQTAVFVHKGNQGGEAQAVQPAADALMPFQAARWLAERVRLGLSVDRLVKLIMVPAFGGREYRLPPSRSPLAGWLVAHVAEFRARLLRERPDIVLFQGDPDLLSDADLEAALFAYANVQVDGGREVYPTTGTIRKLARPSMEIVAFSLLSTRPTTDSITMLALELARYGVYRSCVPLAIWLAADVTQPDYVRAEAVRVTIAAGTEHEQASLGSLVDEAPARVRIMMLDLIPATICGTPLVRFIARGGELEFRYWVRPVLTRVSDQDLDAILAEVRAVIDRTTVDARTEPAFGAALPTVIEFIKRGLSGAAAVAIVQRIIWLHEHAAVFISPEELSDLRDALALNTECRRAVVNGRLDSGTAGSYLSRQDKFSDPTPTDVDWLISLWEAARAYEQATPAEDGSPSLRVLRSHLVEMLLEVVYQDADESSKEALRARLPAQIVQRIDWAAARNVEFERTRQDADRTRAAKADVTRDLRIANLASRVDAIEQGEDEDVYVAAFHYLGEPLRQRQTQRDFKRLAEYFGDALVPTIIRGMKAYWRRRSPPMPDPSDESVEILNLAGLVGLTMDIDDGLDVRSLAPDEVSKAATYALYEINALPYWFDDLVVAHEGIVAAVLRVVIGRAWRSTREAPSVIGRGAHEPTATTRLLRRLLLEITTERASSRQVIEGAVDTLLTSADDRSRVAAVAHAGIEIESDDETRQAQWFRLLAHVNPLDAAMLFDAIRVQDPERYERVLETVASYLEQDLSERKSKHVVSQLIAPDALGAWLRLLLLGIVPQKDVKHRSGVVYAVGSRDHAQRLRDGCLNVLRHDPTEAAHDVLVELHADPLLAPYTRMLRVAHDEQIESACEHLATPWTEDEVLAVERNDERRPTTQADLFALVRTHIADVDRLISDRDDFSYRAVFSHETDETELQLWAASTLRQRARGLYEVIRENVVGRRKKVDISAVMPGAGQVPIEIKPLGTYPFKHLKRVIVEQLLGQYMQPADREHGILLLVRRDRMRWKRGKDWIELAELRAELEHFARAQARRLGRMVAVEAIDLVEMAGSSAR